MLSAKLRERYLSCMLAIMMAEFIRLFIHMITMHAGQRKQHIIPNSLVASPARMIAHAMTPLLGSGEITCLREEQCIK